MHQQRAFGSLLPEQRAGAQPVGRGAGRRLLKVCTGAWSDGRRIRLSYGSLLQPLVPVVERHIGEMIGRCQETVGGGFSAKLRPMESTEPSAEERCRARARNLHWIAGRAGSSASSVVGDIILYLHASRVHLAPSICCMQPDPVEHGPEKLWSISELGTRRHRQTTKIQSLSGVPVSLVSDYWERVRKFPSIFEVGSVATGV